MQGLRKDADYSYVMFGAYNDGKSLSIARIIVNHYKEGYFETDLDDVIYAMSIKKEEAVSHMDTLLRKNLGSTPSKLNITQMLYAVKRTFPSDLPENVARRLEYKRKSSEIDGLKYSLNVDSDGNKLTEAQVEYFKDSKARDKDGRLIKVYHGTLREFYEFDRSYANIEGADFTNKIEREADLIEGSDRPEYRVERPSK